MGQSDTYRDACECEVGVGFVWNNELFVAGEPQCNATGGIENMHARRVGTFERDDRGIMRLRFFNEPREVENFNPYAVVRLICIS